MSNGTSGTMPRDTFTKVREYKESLVRTAELLVTRGFPEIILQLNALLETPMFKNRNCQEIHQEVTIPLLPADSSDSSDSDDSDDSDYQPQAKRVCTDGVAGCAVPVPVPVLVLPRGFVACNKPICDMIKVVKPKLRALLEHANLLKMWIMFMMPKIEDGNNFGVSVQEDTLTEIQTVESDVAAWCVQISAYFRTRGKIVTQVAKHPLIEDYRRSVNELDEQEFLSLWLVVSEVRNRYSLLNDLVIKNLEKLKKPRH